MINLSPQEVDRFGGLLQTLLTPEGVCQAFGVSPYAKYADDPVRFCEEVLGDILTDDIKEVMRSVWDNPITIAKSCNGPGKSQPVETPVLTMNGFVPIGSLKIGDFVFGAAGKEVRVIGIYPQGLQPTYKITFSDGASTLCSKDHLWSVISSSDKSEGKQYRLFTTERLKKSIYRFMHIPMTSPVNFNTKEIDVDPYVMGVLIGDGTLGQAVRFDSLDKEIIDRVRKHVKNADVKLYKNKKTHHGITTPLGKPNPVLIALRKYGLIGLSAKDKHIPEIYLWGDVEQRKQLLFGLMDTDGYIDKDHCMYFCTISKKLNAQLKQLVWSLGGTVKTRTKRPNYTHNGEYRTGQTAYETIIKVPFCPFLLPRKIKRYVPQEKLQRRAHRYVKSVEYVAEKESVCIEVDSEDGLYLTEKFIVTHNSHGAGRIAVAWYKCHEHAQVYTAAAPPERNLKKILWGEIGSIVEDHPGLFTEDEVTSLNIQRKKKQFLCGVTIPTSGTEQERISKFSGKHAPYLLFILDEGDGIMDERLKLADPGELRPTC